MLSGSMILKRMTTSSRPVQPRRFEQRVGDALQVRADDHHVVKAEHRREYVHPERVVHAQLGIKDVFRDEAAAHEHGYGEKDNDRFFEA